MNECVVCFKQSETLCQRCRTPYCSRRCQAEDWAEHKATCIPMPQLVSAKRTQSPRSRGQLNQSVSSISQRLKHNANDSVEKSKQQENEPVPNRSELVQKIKQEAEETTLRPPKTQLPSENVAPSDTSTTKVSASLFDNPFKRNSQNIGFNANDNKNGRSRTDALSPSNTKRPEAQPTTTEATQILSESAASVPVNTSETAEIEGAETVPQASMRNLSLNEEKEEEPEIKQVAEEIFTMKDVKIAPLIINRKVLCLDSSNMDKGYVSLCTKDRKALEFVDRMSSTIADYCNSRSNECYRPRIGELCLCLFDEDNEWYRSVATKVMDDDTFEVEFIDFGNLSTACSKNIRKMPRELLHDSMVNKCHIKDFNDSTLKEKQQIGRFFTNNPIFELEKLEQLESGEYIIEVDY